MMITWLPVLKDRLLCISDKRRIVVWVLRCVLESVSMLIKCHFLWKKWLALKGCQHSYATLNSLFF